MRRVESEDWKRLRDVRLRALATDPDAFLQTHAEASKMTQDDWVRRATPSDDASSYVLEVDGRFDGLVSCFAGEERANVFLVAMWVAPELRGSGAADELVAQVVEWARARGAERVCLSVEAENTRAARLYEKCGFVETWDPPEFPYEPNPGNRFYVYEL